MKTGKRDMQKIRTHYRFCDKKLESTQLTVRKWQNVLLSMSFEISIHIYELQEILKQIHEWGETINGNESGNKYRPHIYDRLDCTCAYQINVFPEESEETKISNFLANTDISKIHTFTVVPTFSENFGVRQVRTFLESIDTGTETISFKYKY